jgi:hypothetical protein
MTSVAAAFDRVDLATWMKEALAINKSLRVLRFSNEFNNRAIKVLAQAFKTNRTLEQLHVLSTMSFAGVRAVILALPDKLPSLRLFDVSRAEMLSGCEADLTDALLDERAFPAHKRRVVRWALMKCD